MLQNVPAVAQSKHNSLVELDVCNNNGKFEQREVDNEFEIEKKVIDLLIVQDYFLPFFCCTPFQLSI